MGASVYYDLSGRFCNSGTKPSQTQLRSALRPVAPSQRTYEIIGGSGFNPKCNISPDPQVAPSAMPSVAEVTAEAMRKRAAQLADEVAYKRAKEASKGALKSAPPSGGSRVKT